MTGPWMVGICSKSAHPELKINPHNCPQVVFPLAVSSREVASRFFFYFVSYVVGWRGDRKNRSGKVPAGQRGARGFMAFTISMLLLQVAAPTLTYKAC